MRVIPSRSVVLLFILAAVQSVWAQLKIPTPPVHSSDGAIFAYSVSKASAGLRSPITSFAGTVKEEMERVLRMKFGSRVRPIEIAVGDQLDGSTNVIWRQVRSADGICSERIELPAPETADLELLRAALVGAFLRTWVEENKMVEAAGQMPVWFCHGVSRYISFGKTAEGAEVPVFRLSDFDALCTMWHAGDLPMVTELMEPRIPLDVAGGLIEWITDNIHRVAPLQTLLEACARGETLDAQTIGRLVTAQTDPVLIDLAFDRWMCTTPYSILQPGTTSLPMIDRWRIQLIPFPGLSRLGVNPWAPRSIEWLIAHAQEPTVQSLARRMAISVRLAAAGRDEMFGAVADSYAYFFNTVANGVKPERLQKLFHEAEDKRMVLEKLATAKPLRRKQP